MGKSPIALKRILRSDPQGMTSIQLRLDKLVNKLSKS